MGFNRTYNAGNVDTSRGAVATVIPPGEYEVFVAECTEGISKSSGKNMLKLELNILTPPYDKRKMWYYIVDDQYADQKTYEIFASAGKQPPQSIHAGVFKGLRCKVKTKNREYNGETQAEVNYWIRQDVPAAPAPGTGRSIDPSFNPVNNSNVDPDGIPF